MVFESHLKEEEWYVDDVIRRLHTTYMQLRKGIITKDSQNFDYILELSNRINDHLKTIACPE